MLMKEYLRQIVDVEHACFVANNGHGARHGYVSVADFILDRGKPPKSGDTPLTEEQFAYLTRVASATGLAMEAKQCFHNASLLVLVDHMRESRMRYFEGLCYSGTLPVHHAWVELDGKLVDLTRSLRPEAVEEFLNGVPPQADLKDRVLGLVPEAWEYLGFEIELETIQQHVEKYEETTSYLDNWKEGHPFFKMSRLNERP